MEIIALDVSMFLFYNSLGRSIGFFALKKYISYFDDASRKLYMQIDIHLFLLSKCLMY
jgi:hypothetical protein